jgi:hypothetical protein
LVEVVIDIRGLVDAGIVDQDVDAALPRRRRAPNLGDALGIGEIAGHEMALIGAELLLQLRRPTPGDDVVQHGPAADTGHAAHDRGADAAAAAGYQDNLAAQVDHRGR